MGFIGPHGLVVVVEESARTWDLSIRPSLSIYLYMYIYIYIYIHVYVYDSPPMCPHFCFAVREVSDFRMAGPEPIAR